MTRQYGICMFGLINVVVVQDISNFWTLVLLSF